MNAITQLFTPSIRASTRGTRLSLTGLLAAALLLSLPATGVAGEAAGGRDAKTERGESFATALSSAGLLSRGSGYGSPRESRLVRGLQTRLRKFGHEPGPIDGLLGPLTEGAILRFQHARGLAADGVVGPQTKARLIGRPMDRPARPAEQPAQGRPAPPAEPRPSAEPKPSAQPKPSARPEPSEGLAPGYAALLGALAAGLLLTALWAATGRRPEGAATGRRAPASPKDRVGEAATARASRLNLGLACAALLAVFAVGAVSGALFATRAAPDATADTAVGGDIATIEPLRTEAAAVPEQPRSQRRGSPSRAAPASTAREKNAGAADTTGARVEAPTVAATPPVASVGPVRAAPQPRVETYRVRAGDSLWPIAEGRLPPGSSDAAVARWVARIAALNHGRIASGDPNLIVAGERLRLR